MNLVALTLLALPLGQAYRPGLPSFPVSAGFLKLVHGGQPEGRAELAGRLEAPHLHTSQQPMAQRVQEVCLQSCGWWPNCNHHHRTFKHPTRPSPSVVCHPQFEHFTTKGNSMPVFWSAAWVAPRGKRGSISLLTSRPGRFRSWGPLCPVLARS